MIRPDAVAGWPSGFPGDPRTAGICLDFDGTLAPIVSDPALAQPLEGVAATLAELAERYAVVAVVSGRPASFLLERLGLDRGSVSRVTVAGLYGLERFMSGEGISIAPSARPWLDVIRKVSVVASAEAPSSVRIEEKGLAVAFHWRTSQDPDRASKWATEFGLKSEREHGLLMQYGRMSIELRPPVGGDKGTVVEELCSGLEAACFIGDDSGDLAAFGALEKLKRQGASIVVKVGVFSDEAPDDLLRQADVVVGGPAQALELLRRLP